MTFPAAKLGFILVVIGVVAGFLMGLLPVAQFVTLASMAFTAYFAYNPQPEVQLTQGPIVTSRVTK